MKRLAVLTLAALCSIGAMAQTKADSLRADSILLRITLRMIRTRNRTRH